MTIKNNFTAPLNPIDKARIVPPSIVLAPANPTPGSVPVFGPPGSNTLQDSGTTGSMVVSGPSSATNGNVATFSGTTGTVVQDSGIASSAVVTLTGSQTLINKTLTSPTLTTPALGTPASGTLTNCAGLPVSTGLSGTGTGVTTALSQNVTGSGGIVLATSPTLVTPNLGAATATTLSSSTGTVALNNTTATIITAVNGQVYHIIAFDPSGTAVASADVAAAGGTVRQSTALNNAAGLSFTLSGLNIQLTFTGNSTITWVALRLL